MNRIILTSIAVACLVAPVAYASTTVYGVSSPSNQVSAPAYYWAINYNLNLQPGDTVSATLSYSNANADLDLTLTSAFYAPVQILPPPGCAALDPAACQAQVMHYVNQRIGRVTCTDTVGASEHHPDGGVETFTATTDTAGTHQLTVINYLNTPTTSTFYSLTVTVIRGGVDVTSSTFNPVALPPGYVINNYVHCAALGLRN